MPTPQSDDNTTEILEIDEDGKVSKAPPEGERLLRGIVEKTQDVPIAEQSPEILDIALSIESHIRELELRDQQWGEKWRATVDESSDRFVRIAELESIIKPEWHPREETPPPSTGHPDPDSHFPKLWASDGKDVWEIWNYNTQINPKATRVKFWAVKRYPDPPAPTT